jgi:uncharacterized protein involved in outer membrane biogenesis
MKLLKNALVTLFSAVVLIMLIIVGLTRYIDRDKIKTQITQQINALTHKSSIIRGDLTWQLFPKPALKLSQIQIGDDHVENYQASIDTLSLNFKPLSLLKGAFIVDELSIDGLNLKLDSRHSAFEKPFKNQTTKPTLDKEYQIKKIALNHSQIILSGEHPTVIKNIQLSIEQFNLKKQPVAIQIKAKLANNEHNPSIKTSLYFAGKLVLPQYPLDQLVQALPEMSIEGQLQLSNVLFNQLKIPQINSTIKTTKDQIRFNPLTMTLYNGESIGTMSYYPAQKLLSLNQTATNLDGEAFLSALLGYKVLSGTLDYSVHAELPINTNKLNLYNALGTVTLKDGILYNLDMNQLLNQMKIKATHILDSAATKSKSNPDWDSGSYHQGNTAFQLAHFKYQLQKDQLSSDSLLVQTKQFQIEGKGQVNLQNHELYSKLTIMLFDEADSFLLKIQKILGGSFPLAVSGTVEHPNITPDFQTANPLIGQLILKTKLEKPLQLIKDLVH